MSFGMIVTRLAWIAQRLVSSKSPCESGRVKKRIDREEGGGTAKHSTTHNKVGLCCFLECKYGSALEAKVRLVFLCKLTHETLERKLAN